MNSSFLHQFASLYFEIAPLLLLGLSIAGLLHVFVSESMIVKQLGRPGWANVLRSTLFAVPLPLCSCSVVPVVASLRRKGASDGASVSFLIAAPQIGADSFFLTQGLMGLGFAVYRIVAAFVTALVAGLLLDGKRGKSGMPPVVAPAQPGSCRSKPYEFWIHVQELLGSLANNLLLGLLLASLILIVLPDGLIADWQGSGPWPSMLAMLLIGVPLYVCATASTPIAAALVLKGLHPGAALVFLLCGPATNMVTIVLMRTSLGWRALSVYLASIAGMSLIAGASLSFFLPGFTLEHLHHAHQHDSPGWLSSVGMVILTMLLMRHYALLLGDQLKRKRDMRQGRGAEVNMLSGSLSLQISGMTCTHCVGRVEEAIRMSGLAEEFHVDLTQGCAQIRLKPEITEAEARVDLGRRITAAGYDILEPK